MRHVDTLWALLGLPVILGAALWYVQRRKHPGRGTWPALGIFLGLFGGITLGTWFLISLGGFLLGLDANQVPASALGPLLVIAVALPAWRYAMKKIQRPPALTNTGEAGVNVRRDAPLSAPAAILLLVYTGLFILIWRHDPEAWRECLYYIAGIVIVAMVLVAYHQVFPYSRAAKSFRQSEFARLKAAWEENARTLMALDSRAFEDAVARLFRQLGFNVQQTPYSGDEGRDAIATVGNQTFLLEMKRYAPDKPVGRPILMKLHSAMVTAKAGGGILIATSRFTKPAVEFAKLNRIRLIDRAALGLIVSQAYPNPSNPNLIRGLCRRCGHTVRFSLDADSGAARCPNGHTVDHPIPRAIRMSASSVGARPA